MKRILMLALAMMMLVSVCVSAQAATAVQTGTGVTVIKAADWEKTYPDVYASYMKNAENDAVIDHVEEYPMIATVYEGMAFNKFYNSARGHYYTVQDVTNTGRPHKLANCFTCKTPDFTAKVNNEGVSAYAIAFEDMLAEVNESVSCYNCHANTGSELVVTHTYLADAMGAELEGLNPETASCAQCHVEYYFDPETKAVTLPYDSKAAMHPDQILAFFEEMNFADYTNPRTGVAQIKVQHPEFETYMGAGSVHASQFSCADCHMEKAVNAAGETYTSHYWMSPLASESIQATCAACHPDLNGFVAGIQAKAEERTIAIGTKLEDLTNKLADAVASGSYTEEELNAIRSLNRKGQFYWDFVFVENSEGAHNSRLTGECLDKAEALIDEALTLIKL
ncbi:MAG: ammonia-forming cytochrome c nitrite reductase subunit c552 [Clostridia bacterium]|nr:ammonia-forming cytochrome c nitrite reductase subunit c552 [Clostridia bacterium]